MTFESASGSSVSLDVARYQFPARPGGEDDWDANWLVIRGEASDAGSGWHFSDAADEWSNELAHFRVRR